MTKFSDIHSHFVYGMDDGAQTRKEMEAMLDAAWQDGVVELIATPHVTPGIRPFHEDRFQRHLEEARMYCRTCGYAITLYSGAENLYTPAMIRHAKDHCLVTMGNSHYVLLEFSSRISYDEIAEAVSLLERSGYIPVLAHVERYRALRGIQLRRLKEHSSVLCQINCASVIDGGDLLERFQVGRWLREELIDYIATDSHDCSRRPSRMTEAYTLLARRYGKDYAKRLMMSRR